MSDIHNQIWFFKQMKRTNYPLRSKHGANKTMWTGIKTKAEMTVSEYKKLSKQTGGGTLTFVLYIY